MQDVKSGDPEVGGWGVGVGEMKSSKIPGLMAMTNKALALGV